jgi:hypothetical protein
MPVCQCDIHAVHGRQVPAAVVLQSASRTRRLMGMMQFVAASRLLYPELVAPPRMLLAAASPRPLAHP